MLLAGFCLNTLANQDQNVTENKATDNEVLQTAAAMSSIQEEDKAFDSVSTGQASAQSQLNLADNAAFASKSPFSGMYDQTFSTDTQQFGEDKSAGTNVLLFLNYRINGDYTARLFAQVNKQLSDGYEDQLGDTRIRIAKRPIAVNKKMRLLPSASVVLPTSEQSKRAEEMITGIELNLGMTYQLSDTLGLFYLPRLTKNFHEFETARNGTLNIDYSILQILSLNYFISDKWMITPTMLYVNDVAYGGTQRDPRYMSIVELGYLYSRSLQLATGVMTGGAIFNPEMGPNQNVDIYDNNNSSLYGKFTLLF